MHVFPPAALFPRAANRPVEPPDTTLDDYRNVANALGLRRAVVVQPSVYGDDNAATLDAVNQLGHDGRAVGVVFEPLILTDARLTEWHAAGMRGLRINLWHNSHRYGPKILRELSERIAGAGWHLEVLAQAATLAELSPVLKRLPTDTVIGNFGMVDPAFGSDHPAIATVRELLGTGRAWLKMSGAYLIVSDDPSFETLGPVVRELLPEYGERLVWGSDWPHPGAQGEMPDDGDLLNALGLWGIGPSDLESILCANPARLYGWK